MSSNCILSLLYINLLQGALLSSYGPTTLPVSKLRVIVKASVDLDAFKGDPSLWEMTASQIHGIQHLKQRKPLMKRALFLSSSVYNKAYHNSDAVPAPAALCLHRASFPAPSVSSMGLEQINISLALSSIQ